MRFYRARQDAFEGTAWLVFLLKGDDSKHLLVWAQRFLLNLPTTTSSTTTSSFQAMRRDEASGRKKMKTVHLWERHESFIL